ESGAAMNPEWAGAWGGGRDDGVPPAPPRGKVARFHLEPLQDPSEDPRRHPEMSGPQLGPAAHQLGTELVLEGVHALGDACEVRYLLPRGRFVGPGELRVPERLDDLEQVRRITHLLAEHARAFIVLFHFPR